MNSYPYVELTYDVVDKQYGVREILSEEHDTITLKNVIHIKIPMDRLKELLKEAEWFIKDRK